MSAKLLKPINSYGYGEFSADSVADLDDLPTTTHGGKNNLQTIGAICQGSNVFLNDGSMAIYILNGDTDTWTLS